MVRFRELYRNSQQNAEIAVAGRETFGNTTADRKAKHRHGSFNSLVITQSGTQSYSVALDGLDSKKTKLPSTGSFTIDPEEGLYFDFVLITNEAGTAISADDLTVQYAIAEAF